jgi:molybdopterin-containing oxidoreductase family iron-sulfur binding subunit
MRIRAKQTDERALSAREPTVDRRTLLKLMGASLALAGLVGCKGEEDEAALPYVVQPDNVMPGVAKWYATAVTLAGYAQPVLGKTFTGRPVKLEGNPDHPASAGKSSSFTQAELLSLYDPNRSRAPRLLNTPATFSAFERDMAEMAYALDKTGGEGFCLLTGPSTSPTLARQVAHLEARWPKAVCLRIDATASATVARAIRAQFGRNVIVLPVYDQADVIVSFGHDFLGPGPDQTRSALLFGTARRPRQAGRGRCHLLVAEPAPTVTGATADRRIGADVIELDHLLSHLANHFGVPVDVADTPLSAAQRVWLQEVAAALKTAAGRSIITVGHYQPERLHRLAMLVNEKLGNLGQTLAYVEDWRPLSPDPVETWQRLDRLLDGGGLKTVVCLNCNPVYQAPADMQLAARFARLPRLVHAGLHFDETARMAHWHVPLQHDLETWSDARTLAGTATIIQPLVRPFFDVVSQHVFLDRLMAGQASDREIVEATWREAWGGKFETAWQRALLRGMVDDTAPAAAVPAIQDRSVPPTAKTVQGDLTLLIRPDAGVWDGHFSENAWMQETPRPLSKLVWENVVQISPSLAARLGASEGDEITVSVPEGSVAGPVHIAEGQADTIVQMTLGYGRRIMGGVSEGLGHDIGPLRTRAALWERGGVALQKTGMRRTLATTQPEKQMGAHDFARVVPAHNPQEPHDKPASFYPEKPKHDPQWGMAIDLDLCVGCNACVTACQSENNIPVVGKDLVAEGREMHWMRVDLYLVDRPDEPAMRFQPVPCMHCEEAPCEMGCPVNAAVHSTDGLNLQVYNRCIGTRTCSSFCPYKVRRFNWFDYTANDAESVQAMRNPDVTVRSRGVMEKCTYCVQRIAEARIKADKEGRPIRDGEVVTACQQACPTEAIVFGNIADASSAVSRKKSDPRNYALIEEAGTKPKTTYLARLAVRDGESGGQS